MVIFMPYYRQHGQFYHSQIRTRSNHSSTSTNTCQIVTNIVCRLAFSVGLLTIALFLFRLSIENVRTKREGSPLVAAILLVIAIISFIRTYQKLRQYCIIMDSRRRLLQRLRERRQAYELTLAIENQQPNSSPNCNPGIDLPSYKELYPSHLNLSNPTTDLPPSYDDYVKTMSTRGTVTYV